MNRRHSSRKLPDWALDPTGQRRRVPAHARYWCVQGAEPERSQMTPTGQRPSPQRRLSEDIRLGAMRSSG